MKKYIQKLKNLCLILSVFAIWAIILSEFLHDSEASIPAAIPFTVITIYIWRKFFDKKTGDDFSEDELYDLVEQFVTEKGEVSASQIQRKFKVGYARAARLIDELEDNGIVDSGDRSTSRKLTKDIK